MEHIQGMLELVTAELGAVAKSDVVLGKPLQIGGVTIVPISRVSVGFGGGGYG
jgi:uncharacterized spore protein YtfJ